MKTVYQANVHVTGGRKGHARSSDGRLNIALTTPKELGGSEAVDGTNPEQLFAAGYAACFESAMRLAARESKLTLRDVSIDAEVGIGPRPEGGFGLKVAMRIITQGISHDEAHAVVDRTHQVLCPYSNAVRGNVTVDIAVEARP